MEDEKSKLIDEKENKDVTENDSINDGDWVVSVPD